jgi:hypothetical protein
MFNENEQRIPFPSIYPMTLYNFSPVVQFIPVFIPPAQPFTPQVPMVLPHPVNQ